jgi:hypothetical protein
VVAPSRKLKAVRERNSMYGGEFVIREVVRECLDCPNGAAPAVLA